MPVITYTKSGNKATTSVKLDKQIFGTETSNHDLLKQAYEAYLANGRGNSARTKTRGLVSGGGKKPWRQKGTGRARFGSSRNPIWRGGGIAFGPTGIENYKHKLSTNAKRQATRQALTLAADRGKVIIVEDLSFKELKTSEAVKFFAKIGVTRNTLVVVNNISTELTRATDNLQNIHVLAATYLNVYDILNADHIVITTDALKTLSEWLGKPKTAPVSKEAA